MLALLAAVSLAAQIPPARSESFVTPDSLRLHYLVQGSGAPLVLLHGFALSADLNWAMPGAMDSLARSFRVFALDQRGHGQSDRPHDPAAYGPRFGADVVALLDHLKIRRAHLAGYSLGAVIALQVAVAHPDRVRSVVLGGGGWNPQGAPPPPFFAQWLDALGRAARGEISVSEALRRDDMAGLPPGPLKAALDRNDPAALHAAFGTLPELALPASAVQGVTAPVHAVVGESDRARAVVDRLAQILPGLTVTVIPGADHAAAMAHPQLAAAIGRFARAH